MQAVPLAFYLFLVELAAGGLIVTALLDWDGEVSGGFLFLNAIFMLGAAAAGIWLRSILPAARLLPESAGRAALQWDVAVWVAVAVLATVQLFCIRTDRRRAGRILGGVGSAAAAGALALSAAAYAAEGGGLLLLASLAAGALVLGTAWSGMMLGHWYLVTPLLAPRPLLRLNAAMAAALVLLGLVSLFTMPESDGPTGWIFGLRFVVGVVLPLALAVPIWRTARVRSMMSATGLLYVALGLVLSGEIMARSLAFLR